MSPKIGLKNQFLGTFYFYEIIFPLESRWTLKNPLFIQCSLIKTDRPDREGR